MSDRSTFPFLEFGPLVHLAAQAERAWYQTRPAGTRAQAKGQRLQAIIQALVPGIIAQMQVYSRRIQ